MSTIHNTVKQIISVTLFTRVYVCMLQPVHLVTAAAAAAAAQYQQHGITSTA